MRRALIIINLVLFALCAYATPVTIYPGLTLEESSGRYYIHFEMPDYDILTETFIVEHEELPLSPNQFSHSADVEYHFSKIQPKEYDYFDYLSVDGRPELPFYSLNLLLPLDGTMVSVDDVIMSTETIVMPYDYLPSQVEYDYTGDISYDPTYYGVYNDTWYWDDYDTCLIQYRIINGLTFSIFPCHYEPSSRELTIVTEATFEISYDGTEITQTYLENLLSYERSVYYYFDNYVGFPTPYPYIDDEYLIITDDNLENDPALEDFVNHKESLGYNVTVTPLHEIGNSPADIRSYIKSQYETYNTKFVLLVGDVNAIPFSSGTENVDSDPPTDLYYSCLSKDNFWDQWLDLNPTVFLGRWPVPANKADSLRNIVNKTIASDLYLRENLENYETNKIALFSGSDNKDYMQNYFYNDCKYIYDQIIQENSCYSGDIIDGRLATTNFNTMKTYLEEGTPTWMFVYDGHGSNSNISNPYGWYNIDAIATSSLDYQPFGFGFACFLGNIYGNINFARSWIISSNGGVSFLGSTTRSSSVLDRYFSRIMFNQLRSCSNMTIGEFVCNAKSKYYNANHVVWRLTEAKQYVLYGDPSLYLLGLNLHYNEPFNEKKNYTYKEENEAFSDDATIKIYSTVGQLLRTCYSGKLDLSELPSGIYTIVFTKNNFITKKIYYNER